MKTDPFQSCGHCWIFQIFWHIECSTFTASSFRIWNSSAGIPSPPLALFIVMLPKAHLTSHSRMSGSRWVIMPSSLSGSWRSFLYSASVYSCHLLLISSGSVRSISFLSFFFFEEISSFSHSILLYSPLRTAPLPSSLYNMDILATWGHRATDSPALSSAALTPEQLHYYSLGRAVRGLVRAGARLT